MWVACYGGMFFGAAIGFSCYSWLMGGILISKNLVNSTTGQPYTVVDIIMVYQAELYGMITFASTLPIVPGVERALKVGYKIFELIDRIPEIRTPENPEEICEKIDIKDGINFKNIHFKYPTAPESQPAVFQGASFKIKSGTSTAIVGPSGSGKSTIV